MTRQFHTSLLLPADPTLALEAATKQYVDAHVSAGGISTEDAVDAVAAAMAVGDAVTDIAYNDAAGTITFTVTVTKADVGLGNVDDTADANKPVSTAQAARFTLVETRVTNIEPTTWTALTFGSGWDAFPAFQVPQYRRIVNNVIQLRGSARRPTTASTIPSVIATLPLGFRPPVDVMFAVPVISGQSMGRVTVNTGGQIINTNPSITIGNYCALDGINFSTVA